jgi:ER membrane protein SH3
MEKHSKQSDFELTFTSNYGCTSWHCCLCNQLLVGQVLSHSTGILSKLDLGALFTHWIADSLTLWKSPITDEHLWTAASYYSILAKGPSQFLYFLAAVVTLGGTTILWSLNDLQAENIMFDGGSICGFVQIPWLLALPYFQSSLAQPLQCTCTQHSPVR